MVRDLKHVLDKEVVSPSSRRMIHHCANSIIVFVIVRLQEHTLWPHLVSLANSDQLRDVQLLSKCLQMVHQSVWIVLRIQHSQFRVKPHMGSLSSKA